MNMLPKWFKQDILDENALEKLRILSQAKVNTICAQARCPNLTGCFKNQRMTFMILGDVCTRSCLFCGVGKCKNTFLTTGTSQGRVLNSSRRIVGTNEVSGAVQENKEPVATVDKNEPQRVARMVESLGVKYAVITSVTRDDLADGGAGQYLRTIEEISKINYGIKIEVLIPDFSGNLSNLKTVVEAAPSVLGHNIETVECLHSGLKPESNYGASLTILAEAKNMNPSLITKSSILLGLGEREEDVADAMQDLIRARCDILVLGQYLAPSDAHYPVREFISLEQFAKYQDIGARLGFKAVLSGPKARSSYKAEQVYDRVIKMN